MTHISSAVVQSDTATVERVRLNVGTFQHMKLMVVVMMMIMMMMTTTTTMTQTDVAKISKASRM
jgi:Zn finger protein HypA/HybF involved in hydrogenase expression